MLTLYILEGVYVEWCTCHSAVSLSSS